MLSVLLSLWLCSVIIQLLILFVEYKLNYKLTLSMSLQILVVFCSFIEFVGKQSSVTLYSLK